MVLPATVLLLCVSCLLRSVWMVHFFSSLHSISVCCDFFFFSVVYITHAASGNKSVDLLM